jgi:plastocyanin
MLSEYERERIRRAFHLEKKSMAVCLTLILYFFWFTLLAPSHLSAASNSVIIHITGASHPPGFQPILVTVHVDDVIVFLNDAQPARTYTIVADDGSFNSIPIPSGQQWRVTMSKAGTYEYHTQEAPRQMIGSILVAPASVLLLPTPDPGAVATEIAVIQTGHTKPPVVQPPGTGYIFSPVLLLVVGLLVLLGLVGGSVFFLRLRRRLPHTP